MGHKPTPTGGRPRTHALKPGFRPQLSFNITSELMTRIVAAKNASGRSQSAEVEHRIERTFIEDDLMAQRFGANAALIETIADAADTARRLGEVLAADEGGGPDDSRIYGAILDSVRIIVAWHDPDSSEKIVNPHVVGGLSWATLAVYAAWAAYNRAASDPRRLAAFKAFDAKVQKSKRTR